MKKILKLKNKFSGHYINVYDDIVQSMLCAEVYLPVITPDKFLSLMQVSYAAETYYFPDGSNVEAFLRGYNREQSLQIQTYDPNGN